ncbi:MAG: hypothetical protein D6826_04230, partial [Alphaproteobacteria bacterium]
GLINLFREGALSGILPVVLPAFSQRLRAGEDITPGYLRGVSYLTGIAWPFFGFVALMAYPIIRILFGPQWDDAVPIARVLCLAAAIGAPWGFADQTLIALGQIRREMYAQAMTAPVQIAALIALSFYGLEAAAFAAVLRFALLSSIRTWNLKRYAGIAPGAIVRATTESAGVLALSCAGPAVVLLTMQIDAGHLYLPFAIACATAAVGWLLGVFMLAHPLRDEIVVHGGMVCRAILKR